MASISMGKGCTLNVNGFDIEATDDGLRVNGFAVTAEALRVGTGDKWDGLSGLLRAAQVRGEAFERLRDQLAGAQAEIRRTQEERDTVAQNMLQDFAAVLDSRPGEGVLDAAKRVANERNTLRAATLPSSPFAISIDVPRLIAERDEAKRVAAVEREVAVALKVARDETLKLVQELRDVIVATTAPAVDESLRSERDSLRRMLANENEGISRLRATLGARGLAPGQEYEPVEEAAKRVVRERDAARSEAVTAGHDRDHARRVSDTLREDRNKALDALRRVAVALRLDPQAAPGYVAEAVESRNRTSPTHQLLQTREILGAASDESVIEVAQRRMWERCSSASSHELREAQQWREKAEETFAKVRRTLKAGFAESLVDCVERVVADYAKRLDEATLRAAKAESAADEALRSRDAYEEAAALARRTLSAKTEALRLAEANEALQRSGREFNDKQLVIVRSALAALEASPMVQAARRLGIEGGTLIEVGATFPTIGRWAEPSSLLVSVRVKDPHYALLRITAGSAGGGSSEGGTRPGDYGGQGGGGQ